jgi:hypothetical protein
VTICLRDTKPLRAQAHSAQMSFATTLIREGRSLISDGVARA